MGVLDKIKNALFEVEYVEVEEPPKKEKKKKSRVKEHGHNTDKPIAKKVVLPGKKEDKVEALEEEELKDEDFEIRPKDEIIKENPKEQFKFMDDKDFQVEDDYIKDEPEIVHVLDPVEDDEPISIEAPRPFRETQEEINESHYTDYYEAPITSDYTSDSKPYGVDKTFQVVHEYGAYEKKEEKKPYFQPSPIISPIYGILNKNYKKEDVREKKEVRITTNYSRSNMNVDDIRNKAYGSRQERNSNKDNISDEEHTQFEVEEDEDNLLVDLSDRAKPEVKELTMGDALEYFQDLGLEYNVDYVDVSKENNKKIEATPKPKVEKTTRVKNNSDKENVSETPKKPVVEIKNESKKSTIDEKEDNDNLFDLIDSMYQETD